MQLIPLLALFVAVLANGSFGVTHKLCWCPNEAFTLYHIIGNAIVTGATIPFLPWLQCDIGFAPLAIVSGLLQLIAIQCVFRAIELAGVALATVGFAGSVIAVAVVGDVALLGNLPAHPFLLYGSLLLIFFGLAGAGYAQQRAQLLHSAASSSATSTAATSLHTTGCHPTELEESLCAEAADCLEERNSSIPLSSVVFPSPWAHASAIDMQASDQHTFSFLSSQRSVQITLSTVGTAILSRADTRATLLDTLDTMVYPPRSRVTWIAQLLGCNLCIGICVYAANAMVLLSPKPLQGLAFAWSFGLGMLVWAPLLPFIFYTLHGRVPCRTDLGTGVDVCFGVACGTIWGIAYVGIDVAIGGGIEESTALSIFQCSIFVAGLWGIAMGELRGGLSITIFFVACFVLIGGVVAKMLS